jgi:hypothetical protein
MGPSNTATCVEATLRVLCRVFIASRKGNDELYHAMVAAGADPDASVGGDATPRQIARQNGIDA